MLLSLLLFNEKSSLFARSNIVVHCLGLNLILLIINQFLRMKCSVLFLVAKVSCVGARSCCENKAKPWNPRGLNLLKCKIAVLGQVMNGKCSSYCVLR